VEDNGDTFQAIFKGLSMSATFWRGCAGFFLVAALTLGATGCGPSYVKPKGKITLDGQPLKISEKGILQVTFYKEDDKEGKNPFATTVDRDGSFEVTGEKSKGLPKGKYRIAVEIHDPYKDEKTGRMGPDLLKGKYTKEKTPLVKDISGNDELTLDVSAK